MILAQTSCLLTFLDQPSGPRLLRVLRVAKRLQSNEKWHLTHVLKRPRDTPSIELVPPYPFSPLLQMHLRQKKIIAKLKSLLCFMRIFSPRRKVNVYHISNPWTASQDHIQPCPREVYLPGHLWDALNPTERFASVADLCAHVGDQLPIQVVKLIARDVLRELEDLHNKHGFAHNGKFLVNDFETWTLPLD